MLETIAVLLIILWLLGFVSSYTLGEFFISFWLLHWWSSYFVSFKVEGHCSVCDSGLAEHRLLKNYLCCRYGVKNRLNMLIYHA